WEKTDGRGRVRRVALHVHRNLGRGRVRSGDNLPVVRADVEASRVPKVRSSAYSSNPCHGPGIEPLRANRAELRAPTAGVRTAVARCAAERRDAPILRAVESDDTRIEDLPIRRFDVDDSPPVRREPRLP